MIDTDMNFFVPFGKHKGEEFKETPKEYQRWLLRQDWFTIPKKRIGNICHNNKLQCHNIAWWFEEYGTNMIGGKFKRKHHSLKADGVSIEHEIGDSFILEMEYATTDDGFNVQLVNANTGEQLYCWTEMNVDSLLRCYAFINALEIEGEIGTTKKWIR